MAATAQLPEGATPIGWDGKTLSEMLAESDQFLEETGRYYGIEALDLKESDPIRFEKIWSRFCCGQQRTK